ncbi:hypothetical protein [Streptomyces mirabilis]|uniref:hypothetical protein n=1 Tax=Streptomyces mirabilis TaxID=68239 RepID=UPI0035E23CF4
MATVFQRCKTDKRNKNYPCEKVRCGHDWAVRFREPGGRTGRQREESFPKKTQAEAHGNKMESDKDQGVFIDPSAGLGPGDPMFTREDGWSLSGAVYCGTWREARKAVLAAHEIDSPLGESVSDLRDARISTWLSGHRTALDVIVIAEHVRVSALSLARRFPHCFQASGQVANGLIEPPSPRTIWRANPRALLGIRSSASIRGLTTDLTVLSQKATGVGASRSPRPWPLTPLS